MVPSARALALGSACATFTGLACSADDSPEPVATSFGDTSTDGGSLDETDGDGGGTADETGAPWVPVQARGIGIEAVEANQGVGVRIGEHGAEVGPSQRTAYLVPHRDTLIRAFWTLAQNWQPREIEAHLTLAFPDGTTRLLIDRKVVDQVSTPSNLDRSFYWGVVADDMVPGVKYRVELFETSPGHEDEAVLDPPPSTPASGWAHVGLQSGNHVLEVVVVPFEYDSGEGCTTVPDTSSATIKLFEDLLFMMNPVDQVELTLHAPVAWTSKLGDFDELNQFLSGLRFDEGAAPQTYYYGLIDACAPNIGGFGGKAYGIPTDPIPEMAYRRVSSGLSLDRQWSAETFVHEVGHSQGRRHVACSGTEQAPDPSYPNPDGSIGEWGFGVRDFKLRHPTVNSDYMTYCDPLWVSSWGWNKVYPIIAELSSWTADPITRGDEYLLVGSFRGDGSTSWIAVPGALPPGPRSVAHTVELWTTDGRVETIAPHVEREPDGDVVHVAVPLPFPFAELSQIAWQHEGDRRETSQITIHGLLHTRDVHDSLRR